MNRNRMIPRRSTLTCGLSFGKLVVVLGLMGPVSANGGLVGHWPLDGSLEDISVSNQTLTSLSGTEVYAANRFNQATHAYFLDDRGGTKDEALVSISDETAFNSNLFTLAMWVNPSLSPATSRLIGRYDAGGNEIWTLDASGTADMTLTINDAVVPGFGVKLDDNEWSHIAIIYNETNLNLYINGALEDTAAYSNLLDSSAGGRLVIGARWKGGSSYEDYLTGDIDDVRVYDGPINETELRTIANLVAWWKMDNDFNDASGHGFTLTATNSPGFAANEVVGTNNVGVEFNGVNQYLQSEADGLAVAGDGLTAALWVRVDSFSTIPFFFARYNSAHNEIWKLGVATASNDLEVRLNDIGLILPAENTIAQGEWIHVALTYDRDRARLYLYGQELTNAPYSAAIADSPGGRFVIGADWDGGTDYNQFFDGVIDDVQIYNRALSPDELVEIANFGGGTIVLGTTNAFAVTLDNGDPGLSPGDLVNWTSSNLGSRAGLTFGVNAFTDLVAAANATSSDGWLHIASGLYKGNVPRRFGKGLRLQGDGASTTFLDGGSDGDDILEPGEGTVLAVWSGFPPRPWQKVHFDIHDLTIQNGHGETISGAFHFVGTVDFRMSRSVVRNCRSRGSSSAWYPGGMSGTLFPNASVEMDQCIITNNTGDAGGIRFGAFLYDIDLVIRRTLISGNTAREGAGGLTLAPLDEWTVENTTISGNVGARAGGIEIVDPNARDLAGVQTVYFRNCTITGNGARNATNAAGGLYAEESFGYTTSVLIENSIMAGNWVNATSPVPGELNVAAASAFFVSATNSLIGDAATSPGITNGVDGNIVGVGGAGTIDITTVLETNLADHGGFTLTHALVPDSPAINAGQSHTDLLTDQRGDGFTRLSGTAVDMGAVEDQRSMTFEYVTGTNIVFTGRGYANRTYQAQYDTDGDLLTPGWTDMESAFITTTGVFQIQDLNPHVSRRFYRLVEQ